MIFTIYFNIHALHKKKAYKVILKLCLECAFKKNIMNSEQPYTTRLSSNYRID